MVKITKYNEGSKKKAHLKSNRRLLGYHFIFLSKLEEKSQIPLIHQLHVKKLQSLLKRSLKNFD
jgi:DNA uptake protein ComE-like DNA-binding protein